MTFEIYSYGSGEILTGVFNAIAMCLNDGEAGLLGSLKMLGLMVGAFAASIYAIYGDGSF